MLDSDQVPEDRGCYKMLENARFTAFVRDVFFFSQAGHLARRTQTIMLNVQFPSSAGWLPSEGSN